MAAEGGKSLEIDDPEHPEEIAPKRALRTRGARGG